MHTSVSITTISNKARLLLYATIAENILNTSAVTTKTHELELIDFSWKNRSSWTAPWYMVGFLQLDIGF